MTMDFHPPRREHPGRGVAFVTIALPIGVLGYWFVSWSLLVTCIFMVFLGLIEVLLYRSGAHARVIRRGRAPLLVVGSLVVVLSVLGGTSVSLIRVAASAGLSPSVLAVVAAVGAPGPVLLTLVIGIAAGLASLIYFARRFAAPGGAAPR